MKAGSYNREIIVNVHPEIAFHALTQEIGEWWGAVDRGIGQVGDEFSVFFESDRTRWTFRVNDLQPDLSIDMECIEADHRYGSDDASIREEWLGTTLRWRLEAMGQRCRISFTHDGLVEELECYEICVSGWDHFFLGNLQEYLNRSISLA